MQQRWEEQRGRSRRALLCLLAGLVTAGCAAGRGRLPHPPDGGEAPPAPRAAPLPGLAARVELLVQQVEAAQGALVQRDLAGAQQVVGGALATADALEQRLPGVALLRELDAVRDALEAPAGAVPLAPLVAQAEARAGTLDPGAVQGLRAAQARLAAGDRAGALAALGEARRLLRQDLRAFPMGEVSARLLEAQALLERGAAGRAYTMLGAVPPLLGEVVEAAVLLPVRWGFRAAALAAEGGAHARAHALLESTVAQLARLRPPAGTPPVEAMASLETRASALLARLEQGQPPDPARLWELAEQTLRVLEG